MVSCLVKLCSNRSTKNAIKKGFYNVPSVIKNQCVKTEALSRERRLAWLKAINRLELFDKDNRILNKVCSDHFITGKPSALFDRENPDWIPTLINPLSMITTNKKFKARRKLLKENSSVKDPCSSALTTKSVENNLTELCTMNDLVQFMDCKESLRKHFNSCANTCTVLTSDSVSEQECFFSPSENLNVNLKTEIKREQLSPTFESAFQATPSFGESYCQDNLCKNEFILPITPCSFETSTLIRQIQDFSAVTSPITTQKTEKSCQTELEARSIKSLEVECLRLKKKVYDLEEKLEKATLKNDYLQNVSF